MPVMRVEKNGNYTVMANYHLRDNRLSLKAKGLLSVMLSLPAGWDYTLAGLAHISREGISAIRGDGTGMRRLCCPHTDPEQSRTADGQPVHDL